MMEVDSKRRRRVTMDIVLGRTLSAADAQFAMQYTAETAQRAPAVLLSALAMLGLGLTQIHNLFPLTTATTLMLVFGVACLIGGIFFSVVILRLWQWHKKQKSVPPGTGDGGSPTGFWDNPA